MLTISPYVMPGIKEKILKRVYVDKQYTVDNIIDVILTYRNQTRKEVLVRSKKTELVYTRQLIMLMFRSELRLSLNSISDHLKLYNHTTVISGLRRIMGLRDTDEKVRQDITNIKYLL